MKLLSRIINAIGLLLFYISEVIMSNLRVAYDVLTPTHHSKPAFLQIKIAALTDRQLLVVANLITMTPGTLSVDVNDERTHLVVHSMYAGDPESDARKFEKQYLRRVQNVF